MKQSITVKQNSISFNYTEEDFNKRPKLSLLSFFDQKYKMLLESRMFSVVETLFDDGNKVILLDVRTSGTLPNSDKTFTLRKDKFKLKLTACVKQYVLFNGKLQTCDIIIDRILNLFDIVFSSYPNTFRFQNDFKLSLVGHRLTINPKLKLLNVNDDVLAHFYYNINVRPSLRAKINNLVKRGKIVQAQSLLLGIDEDVINRDRNILDVVNAFTLTYYSYIPSLSNASYSFNTLFNLHTLGYHGLCSFLVQHPFITGFEKDLKQSDIVASHLLQYLVISPNRLGTTDIFEIYKKLVKDDLPTHYYYGSIDSPFYYLQISR